MTKKIQHHLRMGPFQRILWPKQQQQLEKLTKILQENLILKK